MYYIMKYIGFKIGIKILKFKKVIKKDLGFIWSDWDIRLCILKLKYLVILRNWNSIIKIVENIVYYVFDYFIIFRVL